MEAMKGLREEEQGKIEKLADAVLDGNQLWLDPSEVEPTVLSFLRKNNLPTDLFGPLVTEVLRRL